MNFQPVIDLLRERTGLVADTLGTHAVGLAIANRVRHSKLEVPAYAALLERDASELSRLIDDIVVPETWFFRGGDLFSHLANLVRVRLAERPSTPFRILSIPCSTGEEPYSMAIALLEAGVSSSMWSIQGVDLSNRHIEAARAGVYRRFSFRQTSPEIQARYFRDHGQGLEILPDVRALVQFQIGNLIHPPPLLLTTPFDLVFCRNLFIYLDTPARKLAVDRLARLVAPGGLLAMGHADPIDFNENRFVRSQPDSLFLYQRVTSPNPVVVVPSAPREIQPILAPVTPKKAVTRKPKSVYRPPAAAAVPKSSAGSRNKLLDEARSLANQGRYVEAHALCHELEENSGSSAELFTLQGMLFQATQKMDQAIACYNRALYMNPEHREALLHLMAIFQGQGLRQRAEALRDRLARLPSESQEDS
ncbi:MAG: CheR family methyltransferase [Gemmataceae bacterium]